MVVEEFDVVNFNFPYAHFKSPHSNFQNEWRIIHEYSNIDMLYFE